MLDFLLPFFQHTLLFNSDSTAPNKSGVSTVASVSLSLFDALVAKFGLDSVLKRLSGHGVQDLLILNQRYKRQQKAVKNPAPVAEAVLEKNEESHNSDDDDSSTSSSSSSSSSSSDSDDSSSSPSSSFSDEENPDFNIKNEQSAPRKKHEKKIEPPVVMTEALQRAISSVKDMKRLFDSYFSSDLYLHFPTIFSSLNTNTQEKKPQY